MGEKTNRTLQALMPNGNFKWILLGALLGGGGGSAGVFSMLRAETPPKIEAPINRELIEYRLQLVEAGQIKLEASMDALRKAVEERMPTR